MFDLKKPDFCSQCSKVVQIGNPILRQPAKHVEKSLIKSDFIQETIKKLENEIKDYDAVGLAAPQIGISLKIACIQVTATQLRFQEYENIESKCISRK